MRICVAGAYGAFGIKHLDALANMDGVSVTGKLVQYHPEKGCHRLNA